VSCRAARDTHTLSLCNTLVHLHMLSSRIDARRIHSTKHEQSGVRPPQYPQAQRALTHTLIDMRLLIRAARWVLIGAARWVDRVGRSAESPPAASHKDKRTPHAKMPRQQTSRTKTRPRPTQLTQRTLVPHPRNPAAPLVVRGCLRAATCSRRPAGIQAARWRGGRGREDSGAARSIRRGGGGVSLARRPQSPPSSQACL
jgi:hypothetical protein